MDKKATTHRGGHLEALLNGCPDAILAIDADGIIKFANKEACKLTEREMNDLQDACLAVPSSVFDRSHAKAVGSLPLFDPLEGVVVADPPGTGEGYWAGAPSAIPSRSTMERLS